MHPLNIMRLNAGLTIDPKLESREYLAEAREVPNRKDVAPANEANLKKKLASCEKACAHLKNSVKALEAAPATDTDAKIPQMIADIEELCGELDEYCKVLAKTKPIKEAKAKPDYLDADKDGNKKEPMKKALKDKEEKKDLKEMGEPESFNTADDFKKGEKVLYDNGIWLVHVADAQADMVGIIPPSMKDASDEEKAKAMQQVKRDKLRKPSEEECEVMAGPDGILGTADDPMMGESTHNYAPGNQVSHEDTEEDPINVVSQGEGNWANSLNPKMVKNEYTNQLDNRGDQSSTDYEQKVKVPQKIKTALKDAIAAFERDAEKLGGRQTAYDTMIMYNDTAAAFRHILNLLNKGTVMGVKEAQLFVTSLMGPMLHKLPDGVWDFLVNGGQKRSLKDYMIDVSKK